jgi:hypothetical protein
LPAEKVSDHLGVGAIAHKHHIDAGHYSAIADVEHALGVPFFDRSPQGVEPTRPRATQARYRCFRRLIILPVLDRAFGSHAELQEVRLFGTRFEPVASRSNTKRDLQAVKLANSLAGKCCTACSQATSAASIDP